MAEYLNSMDLLAQNKTDDLVEGKDIKGKIQSFVLYQAQHELLRIIRLTEALDNLENAFIDRINGLELDAVPPLLYGELIQILITSLDRAQGLINNILKDEKLSVFVYGGITNIEQKTLNITENQLDAQARENLRALINPVISSLKNAQNIQAATKVESNETT